MMRQRERMTFKQSPVARGTVGTGLSSNPTGVGFRSFAGVETLLNLQRTHGNAFVQRLVQRKLAVRRLGDKYEQEADRVADAVVRKKDASSSVPAITRYAEQGVHRMCPECEEEIERREVAGKEAVRKKSCRPCAGPKWKTKWRVRTPFRAGLTTQH